MDNDNWSIKYIHDTVLIFWQWWGYLAEELWNETNHYPIFFLNFIYSMWIANSSLAIKCFPRLKNCEVQYSRGNPLHQSLPCIFIIDFNSLFIKLNLFLKQWDHWQPNQRPGVTLPLDRCSFLNWLDGMNLIENMFFSDNLLVWGHLDRW